MVSQRSRPLSLHHSALSDDEFHWFTTLLDQIIGSNTSNPELVRWENARPSMEDARHSLQDHYGDKVSYQNIEKVCLKDFLKKTIRVDLKLYSQVLNLVVAEGPSGASEMNFSGCQYFSALRITHHVGNREDPSRTLGFYPGLLLYYDWFTFSNENPMHRQRILFRPSKNHRSLNFAKKLWYYPFRPIRAT
jgi:hypothetical protein